MTTALVGCTAQQAEGGPTAWSTRTPLPYRILFVTARSFPFRGGVETHVYEVSRRLAEAGSIVTVLSTDPQGKLPHEETSEGVRYLRVRAWPRNGDYHFAPALWGEIARSAADIVHVQGYHTLVAPLAMLAAAQARIPYVVTIHSGGHSSRARHAVRAAQQRALGPLLGRARCVIGVSQFEADLIRQRTGLPSEKFAVIPNGAELPPVSGEDGADPKGAWILSVGRLERYKGHHRVIGAMPEILQRRPDARLQVVGTGRFEAKLRRLADRLQVSHRVEFLSVGAADREAMGRLYSRASLTVLLSEYEAHPISVMEALGLGCPVLVTYTSGLAELADQGLVRSVPLMASKECIAEAAIRSLQNPLVPSKTSVPTWEQCTDSLAALYGSIVVR